MKQADIQWKDGGTPVATAFDDVYFSKDNGLEETRHVFLKGIGAPEIWQDQQDFVIAETGFGTGLNFLATWQLFEQTANKDQRLHFISVEGFPLARDALRKALDFFPELAEKAGALVSAYPPAVPGFHRLGFDDGRVSLTLLFGPAVEMLDQLTASVDGWYLDGFAPSKNPNMWSDGVLDCVASLSDAGTRLATFTAAGFVRRGLIDRGFAMKKVDGFGYKRDCLVGVMEAKQQFSGPLSQPPWFQPPPKRKRPRSVVVIGAGVAGAALANVLSRLGVDVTVVEKHQSIAGEGSGNPVGILNPRLTASDDIKGAIHLKAYLYAIRLLDQLEEKAGGIWHGKRGLLALPRDERMEERYSKIAAADLLPKDYLVAVSKEEASAQAGMPLDKGGLWLAKGGMINPKAVCRALLGDINVITGKLVTRLERTGAGWAVRGQDGKVVAEAEALVLANARNAADLSPTVRLPIGLNRGQISYIPASDETTRLQCAVTFGSYLSTAFDLSDGKKAHVLGATFDRWDDDQCAKCAAAAVDDGTGDGCGTGQVRDQDHDRNINSFKTQLPSMATCFDLQAIGGRAACRATTGDYLPLVGPLHDEGAYAGQYRDWVKQKSFDGAPAPVYADGLYVMAGFGSHGFLSAPLAAEILTAQMMNLPLPVEKKVAEALHPARFQIRELKKAE